MMLSAWFKVMGSAWVSRPAEPRRDRPPGRGSSAPAPDRPAEAVSQAHWPTFRADWPPPRERPQRDAGRTLGANSLF